MGVVGIKSPLFYVPDYANNLSQVVPSIQVNSLPNRILVREILGRKNIVNNCDARAGEQAGTTERATNVSFAFLQRKPGKIKFWAGFQRRELKEKFS